MSKKQSKRSPRRSRAEILKAALERYFRACRRAGMDDQHVDEEFTSVVEDVGTSMTTNDFVETKG